MTELVLPDPCLVVLVGAAGSGKSTFAARHFAPDETLSSDAYRAAIAGDPANQAANGAAFKALHRSLDRRLQAGALTVVDATNVTMPARRALVAIAGRASLPSIAIVLDMAPAVVLARNAARADRVVPEAVVRRHLAELRTVIDRRALEADGFARIVILDDPVAIESIVVRRERRADRDQVDPDRADAD